MAPEAKLKFCGHDEASGSDPMVRVRENLERVMGAHFIVGRTARAITFDENYAI